jgi:ribosomal protein S12 methylthiotransferase
MPITFSIINLGCPKNLVDAERLAAALEGAGYRLEIDPARAELILVNTCGFIEGARQESLRTIAEMIGHKRAGRCRGLVVTGCLSQRYPRSLWEQLPEVDAFLGIGGQDDIVAVCDRILDGSDDKRPCLVRDPDGLVEELIPRKQLTVPHSAYLKIADGCDNRCAYCAIPLIRGAYRSRRPEVLEEEARQMAERGVKELTLIAQDTTYYGQDLYGEPRLPQLLGRLCQIDGLHWIRLMYTHPAHYSDDLIELVARERKICKYLDLPLQHICDDLLQAMNRQVTGEQIEALIAKLRSKIPGLTLRTTFIVGLPGETEEHFGRLMEFVGRHRFEKLGAFAYSPEQGTPAAGMPSRPKRGVADRRLDELLLLQQRISLQRQRSLAGQELEVLVDAAIPDAAIPDGALLDQADQARSHEQWSAVGRSQGEAPDIDGTVYLAGQDLSPGRFVRAQVIAYCEYDLFAHVAS